MRNFVYSHKLKYLLRSYKYYLPSDTCDIAFLVKNQNSDFKLQLEPQNEKKVSVSYTRFLSCNNFEINTSVWQHSSH